METANKRLVHRWFEEVWNQKREAAIREMLDPESVLYGLGDSPSEGIRGPEEFIPFWQKFVSAAPNISIRPEAILEEGDTVAVRCTVRGTHSGLGLGIEPTNVEFFFTGMSMARIHEGKIFEAWNHFDFLALYQQLGLVK